MSRGIEHWQSNKILLVTGGVAVTVATREPILGIGWIMGCGLGMFIHPDWDINHPTFPNSVVKKHFGRPIALIYRAVQYPYAMLIPHRSWISHFPIVSTLIRMCYVSIPLIPLAFLIERDIILVLTMNYAFMVLLIAWFITDMNHILMDIF